MAETIGDAGAGIVFDALNPNQIPEMIRQADYSRLQASARRLAESLRVRNARTLEALSACIASAG